MDEIIFFVTFAIILAIVVAIGVAIGFCIGNCINSIARSSLFHRENINLPQRQPANCQKSKNASTNDNPPKYEDAILKPPDYSPGEFYV